MAEAAYDTMGQGYAPVRRPDPRLAAAIEEALGAGTSLVNVGAGAGSYEPADRRVVAVEPSGVMLAQRPPTAGPAVRGVAEHLPVATDGVDAALAVISVHHWSDLGAGLAEMVRVARRRVVVVTIDDDVVAGHWMMQDYAPEMLSAHRSAMPTMAELCGHLPRARVTAWPVPADCTDGFLAALWSRPEAHLDPAVRAASSVWHQLPGEVVERIVGHLADDLATGRWDERHGHLRRTPALDVGVRIVTAALT